RARSARASCAEQTRPPAPALTATSARRDAISAADGPNPSSFTSESESEASAVTARIRGGATPARPAPRAPPRTAARIISPHPRAAGGVHGEARGPGRPRSPGGVLPRVRDVMELQIEYHRRALCPEGTDHGRAVLDEERQPHLHHPHRGREESPEPERLVERH